MFTFLRTYTFAVLCSNFLLTSCSSINFSSQEEIPVKIGPSSGKKYPLEVTGERVIYLWGLIPGDRDVYIDLEIKKQGHTSASSVQVETYQTWPSVIYSFLSLGFYVPINYKITAFGKKVHYVL
jgi:hypothetical protein